MAALNRGIRLPLDTSITLDNRLFETVQGSGLFTFRPDEPVSSLRGTTQSLLAGGRIELSIIHDASGSGYRIKASSTGTGTALSVESPSSERLPYLDEVSVGVSYNASTGRLDLRVSHDGRIWPADITGAAFENTAPAGLTTEFVRDSAASIGLSNYSGFISKLASYSQQFSAEELNAGVSDPAGWALGSSLVHYLDATNLVSTSRIDTSRPEVQRLEFGAANNTGFITIDGVAVQINRGDTSTVVAQKVFQALSDSAAFKTQVEKQKITFELSGSSGSGFRIEGVTINPSATTDPVVFAAAAKTALEASSFIRDASGSLRRIINNADGSLTITYTDLDNDIRPLRITSPAGSNVFAAVETIQEYRAAGTGRLVSLDGNKVDITFNTADGNIPLFSSSSALGPRFSAGDTGVQITPTTVREAVASTFEIRQTPLAEVQRIVVTRPGSESGELTISGGGSSQTVLLAGSAASITSIVDSIAATNLSSLSSVERVAKDGDSVLVYFKATAGNVSPLTFVSSASANTSAVVLTDVDFAVNTRGESQTLFFSQQGTRTNGGIVVDGVTATTTALDSFNSVARAVESALEKTAGYSIAEQQTIVIRNGVDSDGGSITLAGKAITLTNASAATSLTVAREIEQFFSVSANLPTGVASVEEDGSAVHFTMSNAHGKSNQPLAGLIDSPTLSTGLSATEMRITRDYNPDGIRKTTVIGDTLVIEFAAGERDVRALSYDGGSTGIGGAVQLNHRHHTLDVTSSVYSGSTPDTGNQSAKFSNALYTELVSVTNLASGNKEVVFHIFVDPAFRNALQGGYESVGFTMNYQTSDFGTTTAPRFEMAAGEFSQNLQPQIGQASISWLNSNSVQDFTRPLATVTMLQPASSGFRETVSFDFSNVNIDGIDFTGGLTVETNDGAARYSTVFSDTLHVDRWEVDSTLVSGLNGTTGVGGHLVAYHANPNAANAALKLQFRELRNIDGSTPSLNSSKKLSFDVITNAVSTSSAKFTIELPSNALNPSFTPIAGHTVISEVVGRSLLVTVTSTGAPLSRGASLGKVDVNLTNAFDKTHEFAFNPSSMVINNANVTGQNLYFGYTSTKVSAVAADKGDWVAKDIPRGEFNKFFVGTAPTQADKTITTADALQILKLSTGQRLDWDPGVNPRPGAFMAADLDGSGKINAADALIALRYATGVSVGDPIRWAFLDGNTRDLGVTDAVGRPLKTGMLVTGDTPINDDFKVQAVLVGNLTNPTLDPF